MVNRSRGRERCKASPFELVLCNNNLGLEISTIPEFEAGDARHFDPPIRQVNVVFREVVVEPCRWAHTWQNINVSYGIILCLCVVMNVLQCASSLFCHVLSLCSFGVVNTL
jgi:hypothetical protein